MSLVTITSMLNHARKEKYAVGAFDVSNHDMALAVIEAAEEKKSPAAESIEMPAVRQALRCAQRRRGFLFDATA